MDKLIKAVNVTKKFVTGEVEVTALRGISFSILQGELVVILGPSGSGKSTALNIIGGIEPVTGGEIYYQGTGLHRMNRQELTGYRRDHIGFVFQFYNLMPNLTAIENVELIAQMSPAPLSPSMLMERVGLTDRQHHFPSKLSGGQQQRVAIARALCKNPELLLCDEPTGALDTVTGVQILKLLSDFNREYKKTVILITHNASIAKIADKVLRFRDGLLESVEENPSPSPPEEVDW